MKQKIFQIMDASDFDSILSDESLLSDYAASLSTLLQVYSSQANPLFFSAIVERFKSVFPTAIIVGASSIAQIAKHEVTEDKTVIGITFFKKTMLSAIFKPCDEGDEYSVGLSLHDEINKVNDVVAVMLLATPLSLNMNSFMRGINECRQQILFFGGGAADYSASNITHVYCGNRHLSRGAVAVIFSSQALECAIYTNLGWQPLSKAMTVTASDGVWVKKIDNQPAFDVYSRYINIKNDPSFFQNAIDFPLIFNRDDTVCVRSPVGASKSGDIRFLGDINEGETFKIGYGNPDLMCDSIERISQEIKGFNPEALFIFACCCRYYLLQADAAVEVAPLSQLAPAVGFYTYGEFNTEQGQIALLNSTMVIVAFKEFERAGSLSSEQTDNVNIPLHKNSQIISRLVHFICRVTDELVQSNDALDQLSKTDKLTALNNRLFLDAELKQRIIRANESLRSSDRTFSLLLLDIDHFKQVNDTYGHLMGDEVLVQFAALLKSILRPIDVIGRWGGEEFLIIIADSNFCIGMSVAEKIRSAVASHTFSMARQLTCSIGVSSFQLSDSSHSLISRVDRALYLAKNHGRNRIFYQ